MAAHGEIAIFPLHTVLFPGGLLPLRIFEQRYMEMAKACLREDRPFGVCLIREGSEVGAPATPEDVGCLARIADWDMQQLGLLQITARGERRFRILVRRVQPDGLTRAEFEMLAEEVDAALPERYAVCRRLLERVVEEHGTRLVAAPFRFDSSSWVSARLAEILPLPLAAKQKLLELGDGLERLEILNKVLAAHRPAKRE
ncbi:MAG: LON peptidase substrate-binding domain-containing protein [Burkholderiales bacterium]